MDGAPKLTIEERIMLVLSDHLRFREEFEVPPSMTQEGLARAVGAMRPNIARSLKALKSKGVIEERLAHVTGQRRRKKVYLVRQEKVEEALRLRDQTGSLKVPFEGGTRTLTDISKERGIPLFEVYADQVAKAPGKAPAGTVAPTPRTKGLAEGFYGRSEELRRLRGWLGSEGSPFALIYGMAGIGKSALIEKFRSGLTSWEVVYYRFMPLNSLPGILHSLEVALSTSFRSGPDPSGRWEAGEGMEDTVRDIIRSLSSKKNIILVLDDLHLSNQGFLSLLGSLIAHETRGVKVLAASRRRGEFYDTRDARISGRVLEIGLSGLSEQDSMRMLSERGLPPDAARELFQRCAGHPIALSLAPAEGAGREALSNDAEGFLLKEVIEKLSSEELEAMRLLSVFRGPLKEPFDLLRDAGMDPSVLDKLSGKGLLKEGRSGLEVHPLLADAATKRLPGEEWGRLHSAAARHYLRNLGSLENILEASYHLSASGRTAEMIGLLRDNRQMVLEEGFVELLVLLEGQNVSGAPPLDQAYYHYLLGTAMEAVGERQGALRELRLSLEIVSRAGLKDPSLLFGIECSMGRLLKNTGDLKGAIEKLRNAIKAHGAVGEQSDQDLSLLIWAHNAIGQSLSDMGDGKGALESYDRAIGLAEAYDPGNMLPTLLHNKGRALMDLGKDEEGRSALEQGLELAMELHDDMTIPLFHETLGELLAREGRISEASDHFERALLQAVSAGNLSDAGDRYMMMGGSKGLPGTGMKRTLRERLAGFVKGRGREEARDLSRIYHRLCRLEREKGLMPSTELHEKAARLFAEKGLLHETAKALNNLGIAHKKAGRTVEGLSAYRRSLEISERIKDDKGRAITLFNLGNLLVQTGKIEEGARCLMDAEALLGPLGMKDAAASAKKAIAGAIKGKKAK